MLTKRLKVEGLDTSYSAAYRSQTQEQQSFIIYEVAADWHELMTPQSIMPLPALKRTIRHAVQLADIPPPQSATLGLHLVAHAR